MGLLRASDQMAYKGRINGVVSSLVSTRASHLVSLSFDQYKTLAAASAGGTYDFQRGRTVGPNSHDFPFLVPGEGGVDSINYLAFGKPLPGATIPHGISPFAEFVTLEFSGTMDSVKVTYEISWTDSYGTNGSSHFNFEFTKYDPLRF